MKLNDPIKKHLPYLQQIWANKVTIHHLLNHTHGIIDLKKDNPQEIISVQDSTPFSYETTPVNMDEKPRMNTPRVIDITDPPD